MGKLRILVGDITSDEILKGHDLIVNPTNPRMVCGMGVSGAIFHKAGVKELEAYTANTYHISYFTEENLMQVGMVRITPGFHLGMDILFAQGPKYYEYTEADEAVKLLIKTYENILNTIEEKGYKHILCPSLGTGSYGFSHWDIAVEVMPLLRNWIRVHDVNIDFVLYSEEEKSYYVIR